MNRVLALVICLLLVSALSPACVDTSALDYVPPTTDAGTGTDAVCVDCLTGRNGPCWPEYEPCSVNPVCVEVMQCLIDKGCLTLAVPSDRITCGLPCVLERNLPAADPTVTALGQLNVCALVNCEDACNSQ